LCEFGQLFATTKSYSDFHLSPGHEKQERKPFLLLGALSPPVFALVEEEVRISPFAL